MSKQLTIRIDENIKPEFEKVCSNMGLSVSSAVNVFAYAVVKSKGLPFLVKSDVYDYESYQFENLPKDTQEAVIRTRERREGKRPAGIQFNTVEELTAYLEAHENEYA